MIDKIRQIIQDTPALGPGQMMPLGADISSVAPPLGAYTVQGPEDVMVLSGDVAYHTATVTVDFLADTYDEACTVWQAAKDALRGAELPDVLRLDITAPQADFYVRDLQLYCRRMAVNVDWRA